MSNPNPDPKAKAEPQKEAKGAQPGWHPDTRRIDHGKKAAN